VSGFELISSPPKPRRLWLRSLTSRLVAGVVALVIVLVSTSSGLAMHEDNFMLMLTLVGYSFGMRQALRRRAAPAPGYAGAEATGRAAVSG